MTEEQQIADMISEGSPVVTPPPLEPPPLRISLIAAMAKNFVIGRNGTIPWVNKEDMHHFRRLTMGKPVIMGRKTWESLPGPLKGRDNIVMTRGWQHRSDCSEAGSLADAIHLARGMLPLYGETEAMVIGGEEIYRLFLPIASKIYLTLFDFEAEGDTHFPQLSMNTDMTGTPRLPRWRCTGAVPMEHTEGRFCVFERQNSRNKEKCLANKQDEL